jgi:glycosyltransferase involved in cell wall biosynthesis
MNNPLVSVIVPCYNLGVYIGEAIGSVLNQPYENVEVIIVNDGSTDDTERILNEIKHSKVQVIHTRNQGLSAARNTGILNSKGKYILPLDADDKISDSYITEAVSVLENDNQLGIVYGGSCYFGDLEGSQQLETFDMERMIFYNQIYCSAFFRRSDYDKTNGYDTGMIYGWEDWEFWLSILKMGRKVHFIDKPCFYYRIRNGSMVRNMTDEQRVYLRRRIYARHPELYEHLFSDPLHLYEVLSYYKRDFDTNVGGKIFRKIKYLLGRS